MILNVEVQYKSDLQSYLEVDCVRPNSIKLVMFVQHIVFPLHCAGKGNSELILHGELRAINCS